MRCKGIEHIITCVNRCVYLLIFSYNRKLKFSLIFQYTFKQTVDENSENRTTKTCIVIEGGELIIVKVNHSEDGYFVSVYMHRCSFRLK